MARKQFENYCKSIFDKFEKILLTFLESSGYNNKDISEVILIGGSTLIPKVEEITRNIFEFSKIKKNQVPKKPLQKEQLFKQQCYQIYLQWKEWVY